LDSNINLAVGVKRTKFVKQKTDVNAYSLNETLIEKNKMLLGMKLLKGGCKNRKKIWIINMLLVILYTEYLY